MSSTKNIISSQAGKKLFSINQGDCVHIRDNQDLFQVIGVDIEHEKCWVRKWPLKNHGSPVFEISINQISLNT